MAKVPAKKSAKRAAAKAAKPAKASKPKSQVVVLGAGQGALKKARLAGAVFVLLGVIFLALGITLSPVSFVVAAMFFGMVLFGWLLHVRNRGWTVVVDGQGITAGKAPRARHIPWDEADNVELKAVNHGMMLVVTAPGRKKVLVNLQAFDKPDRARLMAAVSAFAPKQMGFGVHWSEFFG